MLSLCNALIAAPAVVEKEIGHLQTLLEYLTDMSINAGGRILSAAVVFVVGRFLMSLLNKLIARLMAKRQMDAGVQSFVKSAVNILLMVLLGIAVISKLGIETTSFAALLASAGVAIGMALSGNLQNFAGGLIVLLLRPYKVGDFIESQGVTGTVCEIQIFHTILTTGDNKVIYIPNGALSSGTVTNYSREANRRVEWVVGVDYGEDFERVEAVIRDILREDERVHAEPEPLVALTAMAESSVNVLVRVWVNNADYWNVYFDINKRIYARFNELGIDFPFPQVTVHQA